MSWPLFWALTGLRTVRWPTRATPWETVSMKLGCAAVPNFALKTLIVEGAGLVAACADTALTVLRPPTAVSSAAAAAALLLVDMSRVPLSDHAFGVWLLGGQS